MLCGHYPGLPSEPTIITSGHRGVEEQAKHLRVTRLQLLLLDLKLEEEEVSRLWVVSRQI